MKAHLVALAGLALAFQHPTPAQQPAAEAVSWTTTAVPVNAAQGSAYRLQISGRIAPGYQVYGSDFKAELGPNPTRLQFTPESGITAQGALESLGTHKGTDKVFKTDYTYFKGEARLSQLVTVAAGTERITGTIRGQTCYEADGTCQLFRAKFDIALP